jgi:hypothetical protein
VSVVVWIERYCSCRINEGGCKKRTRSKRLPTSQYRDFRLALGNPACCLVKQQPRLIASVISVMLPHRINPKSFRNESGQIGIRPSPGPDYVEAVYSGSKKVRWRLRKAGVFDGFVDGTEHQLEGFDGIFDFL